MRKRQKCFQNPSTQQFEFVVEKLHYSLMGGWMWFHWREKEKEKWRVEREETEN